MFFPDIDSEGRKIGYARVSTKDQKLRMQRYALETVGCEHIFTDHGISGAKADRPGLDDMLKILRPNDTVLVLKLDRLGRSVSHLSDLLVDFRNDNIHFCSLTEGINTTTPGGKFVYHVFSAVAEFQREIIVENTLLGLDTAKKEGKRLGRRPKLTPEQIEYARRQIESGYASKKELAASLNVAPWTLTRVLKEKCDLFSG